MVEEVEEEGIEGKEIEVELESGMVREALKRRWKMDS